VPFRITDCYIKPYACCRHLQPAVEAFYRSVECHGLSENEVETVQVQTYAISAEHAHTGWADYASAQLSFPYIMALGMRYGAIKPQHFEDSTRQIRPWRLCAHGCTSRSQPTSMPLSRFRPARVTVRTKRGQFVGSPWKLADVGRSRWTMHI